jgi:hypothetical protein
MFPAMIPKLFAGTMDAARENSAQRLLRPAGML